MIKNFEYKTRHTNEINHLPQNKTEERSYSKRLQERLSVH